MFNKWYRIYHRVIDDITKFLWLILLIKWLITGFESDTLVKQLIN